MNKKDLSAFRRQFKTDSYSLKLRQLYTVYMKKDNQNVLYSECSSFDMKSESEQEIYLSNFKKLLTGGFNSKIFELAFDSAAPAGEGQDFCSALLSAERDAFYGCCDKYISKIAGNYSYDSDIVISFVNGKYDQPLGKKHKHGEEEALNGLDDTTYGFKFIMCSVSKADDTKRGIYYDASTAKFELNSALDKTVNFAAPIDGFMFPSFGNGYSDINKIIYYTYKANSRNDALLENILYCRSEPTAKDEREKFEEIIRLVNGDTVRPDVFKNVYDAVAERLEACDEFSDPLTLSADEILDIFQESGIKNLDSFEEAYQQAAEKDFEFRAASLIPGSSGTVKISSGVADISLNLENLGAVKQVINAKGRKCLQIELSEDAEINGIALETEHD